MKIVQFRYGSAEFLDVGTLPECGSIRVKGTELEVIHTPGHTGDSVCFLYDDVLLSVNNAFYRFASILLLNTRRKYA